VQRTIAQNRRDRLDVLSVGKHHMEVLFEHVPDRFPINACRLHGNMSNVKAPEPLSEFTQLSRCATKATKDASGACALARAEYTPQPTTCERRYRNTSHRALPSLPPLPCSQGFLNASRVKLISGLETPMQVTTLRSQRRMKMGLGCCGRARMRDAECESLPRVLFPEEGYSPLDEGALCGRIGHEPCFVEQRAVVPSEQLLRLRVPDLAAVGIKQRAI